MEQDGQVRFHYDPGFLNGAGADSAGLSVSMAPSPQTFRQRVVLPWIDGLLPDNAQVRERWAARFGVSARNPFALLVHMGRDCPGAVQFCPPDDLADTLAWKGELIPVSNTQLAARLRELRDEPDTWAAEREQWSLGGAQSKFALAWDDGWHTATGARPTTHIIKLGVRGFRGQALNEHLCMSAARLLGVPAAETSYELIEGEPALIISRFDRKPGRRIHQEDLCQALSIPPAKKYEQSGGPGAAKLCDLLNAYGTADDVWRFAEALAYNYLIGGSDAHAKNFSLLLDGRVTLAPLYDLASSLPYQPATGTGLAQLAMAIAGERNFGQVGDQHWAKLSRRAGIPAERLVQRVRELRHDLPDAISTAINATAAAKASDLPERLQTTLAAYLRASN
jgi:serine/threonine-protein kinase HipA